MRAWIKSFGLPRASRSLPAEGTGNEVLRGQEARSRTASDPWFSQPDTVGQLNVWDAMSEAYAGEISRGDRPIDLILQPDFKAFNWGQLDAHPDRLYIILKAGAVTSVRGTFGSNVDSRDNVQVLNVPLAADSKSEEQVSACRTAAIAESFALALRALENNYDLNAIVCPESIEMLGMGSAAETAYAAGLLRIRSMCKASGGRTGSPHSVRCPAGRLLSELANNALKNDSQRSSSSHSLKRSTSSSSYGGDSECGDPKSPVVRRKHKQRRKQRQRQRSTPVASASEQPHSHKHRSARAEVPLLWEGQNPDGSWVALSAEEQAAIHRIDLSDMDEGECRYARARFDLHAGHVVRSSESSDGVDPWWHGGQVSATCSRGANARSSEDRCGRCAECLLGSYVNSVGPDTVTSGAFLVRGSSGNRNAQQKLPGCAIAVWVPCSSAVIQTGETLDGGDGNADGPVQQVTTGTPMADIMNGDGSDDNVNAPRYFSRSPGEAAASVHRCDPIDENGVSVSGLDTSEGASQACVHPVDAAGEFKHVRVNIVTAGSADGFLLYSIEGGTPQFRSLRECIEYYSGEPLCFADGSSIALGQAVPAQRSVIETGAASTTSINSRIPIRQTSRCWVPSTREWQWKDCNSGEWRRYQPADQLALFGAGFAPAPLPPSADSRSLVSGRVRTNASSMQHVPLVSRRGAVVAVAGGWCEVGGCERTDPDNEPIFGTVASLCATKSCAVRFIEHGADSHGFGRLLSSDTTPGTSSVDSSASAPQQSPRGTSVVVSMPPESDEYVAIVEELSTSIPTVQVLDVERIDNAPMSASMEAYRSGCGYDAGRRVFGWHGSADASAVASIVHGGFAPLLSGDRVGERFGRGTYFSAKASLARNYAGAAGGRHPSNALQLVVAELIVGRWAQGRVGLKIAPELVTGKPELGRYNSLVDDINAPTMHIVQNPAQMRPAYIVTFVDWR